MYNIMTGWGPVRKYDCDGSADIPAPPPRSRRCRYMYMYTYVYTCNTMHVH